ncbi:MipA/OmpV family protein [Sphingomonas psychrotolerans]|uniref:MipA/OmpV family protein n=1 Tax=Sphingomonas psychrotolerans TaxID=1327635 RepID=A0ABU3MZ91_9SPHN|nr:MipA/OmpV family protein [Sphingomonas psychrotolerans]MDT8757463.1 MipA/OmpV family protein [Sphingomonas psychrotolerans]
MNKALLAAAALPALFLATGAAAQDENSDAQPRRFRVALGPQLTPSYPGADKVIVTPLVEVSTTTRDEFRYKSGDQSSGIAVINTPGFAFGPAFNIEGSRRRKETDLPVDEVGISVEAGGFADIWLGSSIRARGELRKGITGHKALVGNVSLDYVARDGDKWLFSVGPRITLSDSKYQRAYFGVNTAAAARTGLPVYSPDGGLHAAGAAATALYQFDDRWGVYGYAKYDRLVGDAADSPIVRTIGSRNQFSGGAALTFTFGGRR